MEIIYFIVFYLASWFGLMQIFRFSTYHRYFIKALPALVAYGALIGSLLYHLGMSAFFFWYMVVLVINYIINYNKQQEFGKVVREMEPSAERTASELSLEKTLRYWLMSAVVYFVAVAGTFLYIYNVNF